MEKSNQTSVTRYGTPKRRNELIQPIVGKKPQQEITPVRRTRSSKTLIEDYFKTSTAKTVSSPQKRRKPIDDVPVGAAEAKKANLNCDAKNACQVAPKKSPITNTTSQPDADKKRLREIISKINERRANKGAVLTPLKTSTDLPVELDEDAKSSDKKETIESDPNVVAFLRENLPADVKFPEGLVLPTKYKRLLETFEHLDTLVRFLFNRKEKVSWQKVKKALPTMSRRAFTKKCLAQIRYVFPNAFDFQIQKGISYENGSEIKGDHYLVIFPNLGECTVGDERKMTLTMTKSRLRQFHFNLIALVKSHHQKFLSSQYPSLNIVGKELMRWHPKFLVEHVADIPLAYLPVPPHEKTENSAQQMFKAAQKRIEEKTKLMMKKCQEEESTKTQAKENEKDEVSIGEKASEPKTLQTKESAAMKGIPASLYEKILAKQKLKHFRTMVQNDEKSKKVTELRNLPDIAMSLPTLFTSQKKSSLPMEFVCKKLVQSSKKVTTNMSMISHLELLATISNNWVSIIPLRDLKYLKMDRNRLLRDVIADLKKAISNAEKSV